MTAYKAKPPRRQSNPVLRHDAPPIETTRARFIEARFRVPPATASALADLAFSRIEHWSGRA